MSGVRSSAVGMASSPSRLEVSTRLAQAYAAGLGDCNPRYFDDAARDVVAPPAFCVSFEWPVFLGLSSMAPLGADRSVRLRGVHALQDSTFHRAVRPGDVLITTGTLVEVRATRAGAWTLVRLDTVDERSGVRVVTSWYGSIYRGVAVDGADARIDGPPPWADGDTPARTDKVNIPIPREAAHVYTECARIWNPIHTERRVALEAGLSDILLHGTATWALAAREIVDRFADGDPLRLARLSGQFRAPVIPGSTIAFEAGSTIGRVDFAVRNAGGEPAIAAGRAVLSTGD